MTISKIGNKNFLISIDNQNAGTARKSNINTRKLKLFINNREQLNNAILTNFILPLLLQTLIYITKKAYQTNSHLQT